MGPGKSSALRLSTARRHWFAAPALARGEKGTRDAMKRRWSTGWLYVLACLPAGLIALDFARGSAKSRPAPAGPEEQRSMVPPDVLVPSTAAFQLEGADL